MEKREAYLKARGWTTDGTPFRCWSHPQLGDGFYLHQATHTQLDEDADVAIDAMLRLPVLEAKLARIVALMTKLDSPSTGIQESVETFRSLRAGCDAWLLER